MISILGVNVGGVFVCVCVGGCALNLVFLFVKKKKRGFVSSSSSSSGSGGDKKQGREISW